MENNVAELYDEYGNTMQAFPEDSKNGENHNENEFKWQGTEEQFHHLTNNDSHWHS